MTNHSTDALGWISSSVTKNPEGLLLLAAGAVLLLRGGRSTKRTDPPVKGAASSAYDHWDGHEHRDSSDFRNDGKEEGMMARATRNASDYISEVSDSVSERASDYASAATEYVDSARRTVIGRTGEFANEAQSTLRNSVDRVLQNQPLAVALAGLTAGALVAAAFPATQMERDTLGAAGERLSDAATSAGERLSKAASVAGDELARVAEEKGLTTDGLKEVARDVSDAFDSELSGASDPHSDGELGNKQTPTAGEIQPAARRGNRGSQSARSMSDKPKSF
jgi:hypothetical protein